jgi:hypothetical protein
LDFEAQLKRRSRRNDIIAGGLTGVLAVLVGVALFGLVAGIAGAIVYAAWNWVIVALWPSLPLIAFWQACIVGILIKLIAPTGGGSSSR